MKTMYRCELCGKTSEDFSEIAKCEGMHYRFENRVTYNDQFGPEQSAKLDEGAEYKEGEEEPNIIHVWFERWNPDTGNREFRCGKYKLVSSYAAPLTISDD